MSFGDCAGNPALRGGPAYVHIEAPNFTLRKLEVDVTSFDPRNRVAGDADSGSGYTIAKRNSYVEFAIPDSCDLSLDGLGSICNATVTVLFKNGKSYTFTNAWQASDDFALASNSGDVNVRFQSANKAEEILACAG